jgi:putative transposase
MDRLFWVGLASVWTGWRQSFVIVSPDTVLRWQRRRFREYWTQLSRRPTGGRPCVNPDIASLVRTMAGANPLWGTARPLRPRRPRPSSPPRRPLQRDRAPHRLLDRPADCRRLPRRLRALLSPARPRQRLRPRVPPTQGMGIGEVLTAPRSPWQNPFAQRLIGSIRRECLNQVVVLGERQRPAWRVGAFSANQRPHHGLLWPVGRRNDRPGGNRALASVRDPVRDQSIA